MPEAFSALVRGNSEWVRHLLMTVDGDQRRFTPDSFTAEPAIPCTARP
jgi:hypothetical protein